MTVSSSRREGRRRPRPGGSWLGRAAGWVGLAIVVGALAACASPRSRLVAVAEFTTLDAGEAGAAEGKPRLAILPFENLSANPAPVRALRDLLRDQLEARGVAVLGEDALEDFMARQRVRYVGGVAQDTAQALGQATGVEAVLITSVDLYIESDPPKVGLLSRLVSTGSATSILWMDGVALSGDQAPGLLGIGLVHDPRILEERAVARIADGVDRCLTGNRPGTGRAGERNTTGRRRYRPRDFYAAAAKSPEEPPPRRLAVLPFTNWSARPDAGEIVALHFVRRLAALDGIEVLEPGVVRQTLLKTRLIQEGGLSLTQAELLRDLLDVDMVVIGRVMDYYDATAGEIAPLVDFSAQGVDARKRQAVWTSFSHNAGDDGVFFFDSGRIYTAHTLASEMIRGVVGGVFKTTPAAKAP